MTTWEPGQQLEHQNMQVGGEHEYCPIEAGLFWYSGFGLGTLYKADGTTFWGYRSEAVEEARKLGLPFKFVDSFTNISQSTFVGD